jgi:predicted N-acetyltransferase YhbS
VQDQCTYDYALVRVVPKVERGERINAGVILHCPQKDFLAAKIELDEARLLALDPAADLEAIRAHLASIPLICAGGADAGPIGRLARRERFHWLVAPRSTIIQTSAVHAGACCDPEAALEHLVGRMVSPSAPGGRHEGRRRRMRVRDEEDKDRHAVGELVAAEFDTGAEADFVGSLRRGPQPLVSLVAEVDEAVVGHLVLAPVPLEGDASAKLMGLGSLAVVPEKQKQGIGSALVREGLERCRALGFDAVVALGHLGYYSRFGFAPAARFGIRPALDIPEDALLAVELRPAALRGKTGTVKYLAALRNL